MGKKQTAISIQPHFISKIKGFKYLILMSRNKNS